MSEHAILDIPEPDYDPDAQEGSRNSIAFVEKFKNVICNIHIGRMALYHSEGFATLC